MPAGQYRAASPAYTEGCSRFIPWLCGTAHTFLQRETFFHQPHGHKGRKDLPSVMQRLQLSPGAEIRESGLPDQTWSAQNPPRVTLGPMPTYLWQHGNSPCAAEGKKQNPGLSSLLHPSAQSILAQPLGLRAIPLWSLVSSTPGLSLLEKAPSYFCAQEGQLRGPRETYGVTGVHACVNLTAQNPAREHTSPQMEFGKSKPRLGPDPM